MSSFGEISEPSSRTVWEDWDDINETSDLLEASKLLWKSAFVDLQKISTFYLLEGKYLADCVSIQNQYELSLINTVPEVGLQLFIERKLDTVICIVKDYDIILSSEIVELLKKYIKISRELVAVQVKPMVEYQTNSLQLQNCLIRQVSTGKSRFDHIQKLEQPNIISGVSAGAISLRYHMGLSGTAITCYVELGEEFEMHLVQNMLESLKIMQIPKIKPNNVLNSNLYI